MAFNKARALQEAEKSVSQGKIAQAIKQYQAILDNDPSDLTLLNTVGDLYIRDRNLTEGLRQFHRLAEAYVREGFNVKAIAIYRKISKVDPNAIETLLKLADLYQQQGLGREAREQYLQVVDFYRKRNQTDKVLEVSHKLVNLDPENINFRTRLAAEFDRVGKHTEAAAIYLEAAEIAFRRDDHPAAEPLLQKAAELDPKNSKILLLRARVAMARNQPDEVLKAREDLQRDPAGQQMLLDAYIALRKTPEASKLASDLFQANPADMTPISTVCWLLAETSHIDEAFTLVESAAKVPSETNHSATILDALHQIRAKAPSHIPTLKLMHRTYEQRVDGSAIPEILLALGHAYEQTGALEKAEGCYQRLTQRDPDEAKYLDLLNAVRTKQGKEIETVDLSAVPLPVEEEELPPQPVVVDADQETVVREALENSDLFSRYNLTEKAIAELEKVAQIYPDQIEVHRRILEISRKGFPERGASAANQLARIFRAQGDEELAAKYEAVALESASAVPIPPDIASPAVLAQGSPEAGALPEFSLSTVTVDESVGASTPLPGHIVLDGAPAWEAPASPAVPPVATPAPEPQAELDLSDDLEALAKMIPEDPVVEVADPETASIESFGSDEITIHADEISDSELESGVVEVSGEAGAAIEEKTSGGEIDEGKIEVEFYLENDFLDEARQAIAKLETKFPGDARVAELRAKVDRRAGAVVEAPATATPQPAETHEEVAVAASAEAKPEVAEVVPEALPEPQPEPAAAANQAVPEPANDQTATLLPEPAVAPVEIAPPPRNINVLSYLAGDLDASLEGFAPAPPAPKSPIDGLRPPPPEPSPLPSKIPAPPPPEPEPESELSPLDGLLAGMEEPLVLTHDQDDPETHYNLGVAFREMGLLDEAIGEFQKVIRSAGKGKYPANFLQLCSLLAICFTEKKMPALAVRWYKRALETPELDDEALLALQYDLGMAYEQSGDARNALDRFTEVYSQNIDFRDVAEKIRELQQKV